MRKPIKDRLQAIRTTISVSAKEPDYAQDDIPLPFKIGSLFLVMSYDVKYSKLEKAIKNFFAGKYVVHMAKDYMQDILGCICEKINEADFGIVVLAGLKYTKGIKKYHVKMNIAFEYGMFKILDKPVMLICEDKLNLDVDKEFSDIKSENYGETFSLKKPVAQIEKRIGEVFNKFIPELAKKTATRTLDELAKKHADFPYSKRGTLLKHYKTQYEIQIRSDFEEKTG